MIEYRFAVQADMPDVIDFIDLVFSHVREPHDFEAILPKCYAQGRDFSDVHAIAVRDGLTLTRVQLYTGRSHQIRVQHLAAGFPLWGDARYGGGKPGQQIALWAVKLAFKHPTKDETLTFTYAPPSIGAWKTFSEEIRTELGE